jgi:uncharacterized DUF497 family protein
MRVEFDPAKDTANRRKHGIGLGAATILLEGPTIRWIDTRRDWGETRMVAVGLLEGLEFTCVYAMRATTIRIISLRRSRREERARFHATTHRHNPPR